MTVGSEDFLEAEENETFYDSLEEQTECEDEEISRQETDPTIESEIRKGKLRRNQKRQRKFAKSQRR